MPNRAVLLIAIPVAAWVLVQRLSAKPSALWVELIERGLSQETSRS